MRFIVRRYIMEKKVSFINLGGRLITLDHPFVMGILNATPDSFYAESRVRIGDVVEKARKLVAEGADIIDVGAQSTRPGAAHVGVQEELERLLPVLIAIRETFADIPLSVDTYYAEVARKCVETIGACIINDIGGGTLDPDMKPAVAELRVPYVLMHMRGNPATMQQFCDYTDVAAQVVEELAFRIADFSSAGVADIIIDPGFGFAKTTEQNFELMRRLREFEILERPLLVGISRKSMIWKPLGCTPEESLNGTTALNMLALERGAKILRVHDALAARQTIKLFELTHTISSSYA